MSRRAAPGSTTLTTTMEASVRPTWPIRMFMVAPLGRALRAWFLLQQGEEAISQHDCGVIAARTQLCPAFGWAWRVGGRTGDDSAARVLGPLEIVRNDECVRLGSAEQRRLLAVLLVHANEVVSSDRLVDVLWADGPPASVIPTLRTLVSRLRTTLSADRLEMPADWGIGCGWRRGEVDALRFEELVREGLGSPEPRRVRGRGPRSTRRSRCGEDCPTRSSRAKSSWPWRWLDWSICVPVRSSNGLPRCWTWAGRRRSSANWRPRSRSSRFGSGCGLS